MTWVPFVEYSEEGKETHNRLKLFDQSSTQSLGEPFNPDGYLQDRRTLG